MNRNTISIFCIILTLSYITQSIFANESPSIAQLISKAEQGDIESQVDLGLNYCMGIGVKKDYKKAFKLLSVAAAEGHSDAQYN